MASESSSRDCERVRAQRGIVALVVVMLLLVALCVRLIYIETALGDGLRRTVERQHSSQSRIPARRGMILDRQGRVVAASRQEPDVFVDPVLIRDLDELSIDVGLALGIDPDDVRAKIEARSDTRFLVVAERINEADADAIRDLDDPAVGLQENPVRHYPLGESLAHVLGFVGRDQCGLEGIELAMEDHLHGKDGTRATLRDARRRAVWRESVATSVPVDGGHVVLTIDAEIQRIVEDILEKRIHEFEAESGVSIVMVPQTGEILAMACWPSFNPNSPASYEKDLRRNRAVTDPVEPGSTFKPFIAGGALLGGFVNKSELFDCHMGQHYFGRRLVRDVSPNGMMNLQQIVCKSSNVGMAQIGIRMGPEALHATMERFGFGSPTGVGFPGEDPGVLHPLSRWTSYSVTSVPMGYEIGVTPLQLITAFCAILNDGVLIRPRLVQSMLASDGSRKLGRQPAEVATRALPSEVAEYLSRVVLPSVVHEGTGRHAKLDGYGMLGKTGTAKLSYRDRRGYEDGAYLASFVGAAPERDPKIAALVMIRRPNRDLGYGGGRVSAPAARDILGETLTYMQVPPEAKVAATHR